MKPEELKPYFEAARDIQLPEPAPHFQTRVLASVRALPRQPSVVDHLALLFPRGMSLAMVVLGLLAGWEYLSSESEMGVLLTETTLLGPEAGLALFQP